jgi:large subunit ribosomal protein L21
MYAVIKTGGKQYRVKAGDVLVVEKLGGEPGSSVAFDEVLMLGDDGAVVVGAPTVAGASVSATLIETRKGEKIKVFKKIRRQGYRRTGGHRQQETVLRVTSVVSEGKTDKWDGEIDLTPLAVLNARARGLKIGPDAPVKIKIKVKAEKAAPAKAEKPAAKAPAKAAPAPKAEAPVQAEAAEAPKPAAKAKAAPKAKIETTEAKAPAKAAAPKAAAEKKPAAPKAAPKAKSSKSDADKA